MPFSHIQQAIKENLGGDSNENKDPSFLPARWMGPHAEHVYQAGSENAAHKHHHDASDPFAHLRSSNSFA